jgi:di/tricarboxylate transporter
MEWQGWFSLGLTLLVLVSLIFTRLEAHWLLMAALTVLSACGILTADEAFAGFSNSGLMTVAAMFILAAGIHSSGGVDLLVRYVLRHPKNERHALWRLALPVVALSAFLNNTPVVATLIPAVRTWAKRIDIAPSKLMIPLSYAAILGGTITLIGTSTNLVVNGQYQSLTGEAGFSLFSIAAIGLPAAMIGVTFMVIFFPRLLPDRRETNAFDNLKEFTLEVAIAADGPLVGKTVAKAGLRQLKRIYLVEIERGGIIIPAVNSEEPLQAGDRLVFAGETEAITDLLRIKGIVPSTTETPTLAQAHAERRLVEAVVSPHCDGINQTIRDSQFRDRYGAVVLAVARNGERVNGNLGSIRLKSGDTLLLDARPAFVTRQKYNKDFLLINDLEAETPRHQRAYLAWTILAIVVGLASFEVMSMLNAGLIGAAAMLISGCCSLSQAQKSIDMSVLVTIAASFALGAALEKTGVAAFIAQNIVELSYGHPLLILLLVYLIVSLFTEIITNNAAALLMLPIVLNITSTAHLNPEPYVFAIMMAASASFATPLGYQTNLMVYGPGGYKFKDFLKVGIPMNILMAIITVSILWLFWPLTL